MLVFNPPHPGEFIREIIESLCKEGTSLTIEEVALGLGTTRKTLSALMNGRQSVTPEMALRLAAAFQNNPAEFWLKAQEHYDLAAVCKRVDVTNVRVFWNPQALPPASAS